MYVRFINNIPYKANVLRGKTLAIAHSMYDSVDWQCKYTSILQ